MNALTCWSPLCLQWLCSYALWPIAFLMGADVADCPKVAELLGVKTFVNEYLAYSQLGDFMSNRARWEEHIANNGTYYYIGQDIALNGTSDILINGFISVGEDIYVNIHTCKRKYMHTYMHIYTGTHANTNINCTNHVHNPNNLLTMFTMSTCIGTLLNNVTNANTY